MKPTILLLFFYTALSAQPIKIINTSGQDLDMLIWKDSKLIHHHVMHINDVLLIENIGTGLLIQWKFLNCEPTDSYLDNDERLLLNGYMEQHIKVFGWTPLILKFRPPICYEYHQSKRA